jgi:hypothetical protein
VNKVSLICAVYVDVITSTMQESNKLLKSHAVPWGIILTFAKERIT